MDRRLILPTLKPLKFTEEPADVMDDNRHSAAQANHFL